jgi:HAD superfamily hydrolase (TIGR01450 family)
MGKLTNKRLFLLDMDGTIYLDNDLFDGTLDFLSAVKASGGKYLFVTNNSSKSTDDYVQKLAKIGIESDEDDFLTSTDATCLYLKRYEGKKFYVSGTKSFEEQLKGSGVITTTDIEDDIFGIVMGNDTELTFKKLDDVSRLLTERDLVYIATNPDWVCPTSYGYVPDCGAVAEMIKKATGKSPRFIGKPRPEMLLLAMEKFGYSKDDTLMIGDRVYTDIASGYNAGVDTVLVLSGEGTKEDAENADTKPTYIMNDIREVYDKIYN